METSDDFLKHGKPERQSHERAKIKTNDTPVLHVLMLPPAKLLEY